MSQSDASEAQAINARVDFGFKLSQLARHWRWWLDARLSSEGLSQATWITLSYLNRGKDGMTQRELADFIGIQGPTLVRHLDTLEDMGLAERRQKEGDRRVRTVHLTDTAHQLMGRISARSADLASDMLAGISDEALENCINVFAQVMANSEKTLKKADNQTPGFFD